jgi:enoyl-[acyl-carrier protein] reductase II
LIKKINYQDVQQLYEKDRVKKNYWIIRKSKSKRGMFEGDLTEGELEIGQVAGLIHDIKSAAAIIEEMITDFESAKREVINF